MKIIWIFPLIFNSILAQYSTNDDFIQLRIALSEYIMSDPQNKVPTLVRASFHDLVNFNPFTGQGGPHGCILDQPIIGFKSNNGLSTEIKKLAKFVSSRFSSAKFTFGDVVSLAGKVAVELAYPCLQIPWRYGRRSCMTNTEREDAPGGEIDSLRKLSPFLVRYGLTPNDMAVLIAGSHGIAHAAAETKAAGFGNFDFAKISSGWDWIMRTLYSPWRIVKSSAGKLQYVANDIMRLPSDMTFFPSVVLKTGGPRFADNSARPVESYMISFATKDRSVFDMEFGRVFAKMLEIGVDGRTLIPFVEPRTNGVCLPGTNFLMI